MADKAKTIWESKIFWVALIQITLGILTAINQELLVGSTITLLGFINIVLRVVTTSPIKFE